jgi:L-ascorbate metabolism protein UlaG (beta-lactamase superfamily)
MSGLGRRGFLRTTAAGAALVALPETASPPKKIQNRAEFRWLGTAGWRIDVAGHTVLIDPYLSRYDTGGFNPQTPLTVDEEAVAAHAGHPETILVTHTHWDHFNDVPHLARTTGARVLGTLTAYHLGVAEGIPVSPVKGGEVLDFGAYTVEVIPSLHSRNAAYSMAFPGVRVSVPPKPATIGDLPEGDTLSYQVTIAGGASVFFMGASDFVERNLRGLRPDVAMIAVPSTGVTARYVPRLLAALDHPSVVVPVHWDNFERPLRNPPPVAPADEARLTAFIAAVRAASPRARVLRPEYATPYLF